MDYELKINQSSALNQYYGSQKYIRNSSPYFSRDDRRYIDYMVNKQRWLTKKGFQSSVGNYSMINRDIKNYVQETPSESPLVHKFREVEKSKWMSRKGFV